MTKTANTTTITSTSSSSTRARTRETIAAEAMAAIVLESIRQEYLSIFGRPLPRYHELRLSDDLESGTPGGYYKYALQEAAIAPAPSWRYVLAIVARLKRQQVPEEDLIWWLG